MVSLCLAWQTLFKVGELFFGFFARIRGANASVSLVRACCLEAKDYYGYFQCINPEGVGQHQSHPLSEVHEFLPEKKKEKKAVVLDI